MRLLHTLVFINQDGKIDHGKLHLQMKKGHIIFLSLMKKIQVMEYLKKLGNYVHLREVLRALEEGIFETHIRHGQCYSHQDV